MTRTCRLCGNPLPAWMGGNNKYCSSDCRIRANRRTAEADHKTLEIGCGRAQKAVDALSESDQKNLRWLVGVALCVSADKLLEVDG